MNPIYEQKGYYSGSNYDWAEISITLQDDNDKEYTFKFNRPRKQMDNTFGEYRAYCPKDLSYDTQFLYNQECTLKIYQGEISGHLVEISTALRTSPWVSVICGEWLNAEEYNSNKT